MLGKNWRVASYFAVAVLVLLTATPAFADSDLTPTETAPDADADDEANLDEESEVAADSSTQTSGGGAATGLSKLSVHGYLTQAWADADFLDVPTAPDGTPLVLTPTRNETAIGIPEDGTTNYRFLALQFRYDISDKDIFVVQFSSRTLGFSPLQEFEEEVELDWAFYERRLTDNTSLKVGRIQIPIGIYNEVRDVGTLLPFYRPAFIFYREGAFTSETIDGLSIAHTFAADSDWSLEATGFFGEWTSISVDLLAPENSGIITQKDGVGGQLWLNTPVPGLRIGTGFFSFDVPSALVPGVEIRRDFFHASLDGSFNRFTIQAEWSDEPAAPDPSGFRVDAQEMYLLAGVSVTDKFKIWGQIEQGDVDLTIPGFASSFSMDFREDIGAAVNYFFAPNMVLKAEHHWVEEQDFIVTGFDPAAGVLSSVVQLENGSYTIVAFSVSF